MKKQMHINLFIYSRGHHEASWRHPLATPRSLTDVQYYIECAQKAEAACFDSIFLADTLAAPADLNSASRVWLEPLTTLGSLAVTTSRIGLIATASTTYTEPFNLARQLASVDHSSGGRVGWNIVTTFSNAASRNFGSSARPSHAERYDIGDEFVEVAKALWDSWSDDAIVDDRTSGVFARKDRIRPINHEGRHYQVAGPLNIPRSPQGRPVLVQAGSSDTGMSFAARHAEAVFTAHLNKATAQPFYADLKARTVAAGRPADQILILPGISPMIAGTEAEAKRMERELNELGDPEIGRMKLSDRFDGMDLSHLPLDRRLSPEDFPDAAKNEASRGRVELILRAVREERPTLRQLLAKLAGARGHHVMAGTPEQVADVMEDWIDSGAADGFNLMPPILPLMLDAFTSEVVPILRRRGRFRTEYRGTMLRDHYGLSRPSA
ncbi:MAG: LLM class flavin-dependent oxidoreductase [Hyphomicrobiaceae bacterium]|nr:LLM class flavin-dependent oxidoreductase [Hyphomicrobiaceae bacterium]